MTLRRAGRVGVPPTPRQGRRVTAKIKGETRLAMPDSTKGGIEVRVRPRIRGQFWLLTPSGLLLLFVFVIPNLLLFLTSFYKYENGQIVRQLSLSNYVRFFTDWYYLNIFLRTIELGIAVGASTVILGYPVAYFLTRSKSRWKGVALAITLSPLLVSVIVRTYGWMVLLEDKGIINQFLKTLGLIQEPIALVHNFRGIWIGLTHVELPYSILAIMAALQAVDPVLERAAQNLGANPVRTFFRITLPLSLPGVLTGFLLTFSSTLSAYAAPRVLGGRTSQTTATMIYEYMFYLLDWPFAATIALIVIVIVLGALLLAGRYGDRKGEVNWQ